MGLFNREKKFPEFRDLNKYENRDLYFVQCASWYWLNKKNVAVIDPHNPRILTLDPWPEIIFIAADGSKTIAEYVYYAASRYEEEVPSILDQTILNEIKTLLEYRIIKLSKNKGRPDDIFDLPR